MGCGCQAGIAPSTPTLALPIIQTRAGMCLTCRYMPADDGVRERCPLNPMAVPLKYLIEHPGGICYDGRWPDRDGMVRWRGRRWFGVPDQLRWKALWTLGREARVPGCGCDAGLKASRWGRWLDPWARISGEFRGRMAVAMVGWRECVEGIKGVRLGARSR